MSTTFPTSRAVRLARCLERLSGRDLHDFIVRITPNDVETRRYLLTVEILRYAEAVQSIAERKMQP